MARPTGCGGCRCVISTLPAPIPRARSANGTSPETHLVPLVLEAALGERPQIDIYGTDYPTPDGTAIRDYIHVQDLAEAHLRALEHLAAGRQNAALNLGTGRGHSVREVIRTAEAVSGKSIPCRETAKRPGDPPVLVADPGFAAELLGWRARVSDLDTIVRTALAWHVNRSAQSRRAEQS